MSSRYSRRAFLRGLGASGALLPFLDIELGEAATAPKRFCAMVWPNGVRAGDFWPSGGETDFVLKDVMSPLSAHRSQLLILDNIDNRPMMDQFPDYGGHASIPFILTGGPGKYYNNGEDVAISDNISVDQHIANDFAKRATKTPIHSLIVGVDNKEETDPSTKYISFRGKAVGNQQNAPAVEDDVHATYKKLFGTGTPAQTDTLDKLRKERKSILDVVGKDLERFSQRLGTDAKAKVTAHLTSIRQIEKQLDTVPPSTGGQAPTIDKTINPYSKDHYDKIAQAQIDMIAAAFASNQTQVATMMMSNGHNNTWVFKWLGGDYGQPGDGSFNPLRSHHEIAHRGGGAGDDARRKNGVDKYFMTRFAQLIERCKGVTEGGQSMLDNSVLLIANNMGDGGSHSNTRVPWILAGSGGGYFRTGRYVKQNGGKPLNQVLVSVANAMGVPTQWFGQEKYGGELVGLK